MGKSTKKKNKKITAPKANIQELSISRDGGQIALRGYSYQFLYSCYLILSSSNPSNFFQLEGIEDIDCIMQKNGSNDITHIQLKYSVNKQDASFLTDVLKNFLEAYLLDQNRFFKLVYDFPVAKGHLSKIFASKLDEKSRTHWAGVISNIKKNNPSWNWSVYDFDKFISHLSFEKIEKSILATEIEKTLIRIYEINTDNVSLFANSIKILCFEKMEQRAYVTKAELDSKIQSVKIDISKGPQNPAHSWIRKLDYSKPSIDEGCSFYEGKKATPADIVSGFPIKRPSLEKDVINSICENMVTVIKASSGQGKTTLALRAAYILQNEYIPYQLLWCDEIKEIGNIVQYFKARIQLGEKILILIDNLDNHLSKWNYLVQLLQSELHCHYKLLITSREMDWYNYSGDLSNIQSLKVIKPVLEEKEAIEIFNLFREAKQLHPSITSWQRAWNKIAERQLLIEYVYLLTHGEMLSERIASQISEIGQSSSGKAKCEILRKVCFADLCGVRLSAIKLSASQSEDSGSDFGELLKGMESEFLVHVNEESGYIEGLHPIRSRLAMVNLTIAQSALVTMQNYFAEIAIDFSFQERQLTLCVMETQNIERLIMCCSYYQTHSPNKYFNKYQISNWYDGHCRDERKIVEDGLSELESKYSIHFPDQIYTIDMLSYYPIIVGNFDMASESNLTEWLLGCIAFADAPFDYLVILSAKHYYYHSTYSHHSFGWYYYWNYSLQ